MVARDEHKHVELPKEFLQKMRGLLGEREYAGFVESYGQERTPGLRLNPLKVLDAAAVLELTARFGLEKIPWAESGYYYDRNTGPGRHVWHEARQGGRRPRSGEGLKAVDFW